jgi:hypothetical protein
MKPIVCAALVVFSFEVAAQRRPELEGRWLGQCTECAPNAKVGGVGRILIIRASGAEITIQRDGRPDEVYQTSCALSIASLETH